MPSAAPAHLERCSQSSDHPPICASCSYPVSGLPANAPCPECGQKDALATALHLPPDLTPRRLVLAHAGSLLTVWGSIISYLLIIAAYITYAASAAFFGPGSAYMTSGMLLSVAAGLAGVAALTGLWFISYAAGNLVWTRRLLRVSIVLSLLVGIASNLFFLALLLLANSSIKGRESLATAAFSLDSVLARNLLQTARALSAVIIFLAAATIVVRLSQHFGRHALEGRARRARWLVPLVIIGSAVITQGFTGLIYDTFWVPIALAIFAASSLIVSIIMIVVALRIFWNLATVLKPWTRLNTRT